MKIRNVSIIGLLAICLSMTALYLRADLCGGNGESYCPVEDNGKIDFVDKEGRPIPGMQDCSQEFAEEFQIDLINEYGFEEC